MFKRVTYGDLPASTYLQIIMQTIIALDVKTEFAKKTILQNMYVDDGLQASRNQKELKEGLLDLKSSLEKFGFELKHLFFNFETTDDIQEEQSLFHLRYNIHKDLIGVKLNLNLFPKNRGVPKGPNLIDMKFFDNIKLTKTVASRLVGQIFDLID